MWIRIKAIPLIAYHGVLPHEREHGSQFEIDIEIELDARDAETTDDLKDTIDYAEVYKLVTSKSVERKFDLIEAWSAFLIRELTERYSAILSGIVRIRKYGAPIGGPAAYVEIENRFMTETEKSRNER